MSKLRIREIMKKKGVTSKLISESLGISSGAVAQRLNEDANLTIKALDQFANILSVPTWYLFEDAPEPSCRSIKRIIVEYDNDTFETVEVADDKLNSNPSPQ